MNSKTIPLDSIGLEPRYYPRVNGMEDWVTVHKYTDALKADPKRQFPPIVVVLALNKPYRHLLLDGKHRCKAYHAAGRESIPAVVESLPESRWFARSVELNASHGRALDAGDKAWIAKRLEDDGFSLEESANLLHMQVDSLRKIVAERVVKVRAAEAKKIPEGRGNKRVGGRAFGFLKAPFTDFAGSANAEAVLTLQTRVTGRDCLQILDQAIAVLEAGVDTADEQVALRLARLRALCS